MRRDNPTHLADRIRDLELFLGLQARRTRDNLNPIGFQSPRNPLGQVMNNRIFVPLHLSHVQLNALCDNPQSLKLRPSLTKLM